MAPSSVRNKLFTPMTRYIESQIASGVLKPNDRLAPLRQWSEEFDINLDAARRGMWYLQGKGLVECRRGSGVYVRDFGKVRQNHAGSLQIGLVFASQDLERSYCAHALRGIRQQQKSGSMELRDIAIPYSRGEASAEFGKCADEINAQQSIIMLGNYDRQECDFSWLHIPAVGVEMHLMYGGLFSVVSMDPVNAAELATDYFLKHGKKTVRVFVDPTPLHTFRAQIFQAIFSDAGGQVELQQSPPYLTRLDRLAMPDELGYLFTGGESFQQQAILWQGDLAHERCVITLDAKSELLPDYRHVTTIGPDWRQVGILALEEAERRAANPGYMAKRIYANVNLIER